MLNADAALCRWAKCIGELSGEEKPSRMSGKQDLIAPHCGCIFPISCLSHRMQTLHQCVTFRQSLGSGFLVCIGVQGHLQAAQGFTSSTFTLFSHCFGEASMVLFMSRAMQTEGVRPWRCNTLCVFVWSQNSKTYSPSPFSCHQAFCKSVYLKRENMWILLNVEWTLVFWSSHQASELFQ